MKLLHNGEYPQTFNLSKGFLLSDLTLLHASWWGFIPLPSHYSAAHYFSSLLWIIFLCLALNVWTIIKETAGPFQDSSEFPTAH